MAGSALWLSPWILPAGHRGHLLFILKAHPENNCGAKQRRGSTARSAPPPSPYMSSVYDQWWAAACTVRQLNGLALAHLGREYCTPWTLPFGHGLGGEKALYRHDETTRPRCLSWPRLASGFVCASRGLVWVERAQHGPNGPTCQEYNLPPL